MTRSRRTTPVTTAPQGMVTAELEAFGMTARLILQYNLDQLDPSRTIQVRDDPDDNARSADYAVSMRAGAKHGPPLVTRDAVLVDGSGRVGAYKILNFTYAPEGVWVVDLDWATATDVQKDALRIIAATFNSTGPKPLTDKEQRRAVVDGVRFGLTNEHLALRFQAKSSLVTSIRAEIAATNQLAKSGVDSDVAESLSKSVLRELGKEKARNLLARPYHDLTELIQDADLKVSEVRKEIAELADLTSEGEQLDYLSDRRLEEKDRIREVNLKGRIPVPAPAAAARRALGVILKHKANPDELIERQPALAPQYLDVLNSAIAIMQKVVRAQENL